MFLPIIKVRSLAGVNGRNSRWRVLIDPDAEFPAAVLAQECFEARWKWWPYNFFRRRFSKAGQREMEILGHEAEVQAAVLLYGQNEGAYRSREADGMIRSYDGLFSKYTVADLSERMERVSREQRLWVNKHLKFFTKWTNKLE